MRGMREFGNALMTAVLSIVLTLGSLSISLVGFSSEEDFVPTNTAVFVPPPVTATNTLPPTSTPIIAVDTPTATSTNTLVPVVCQPPAGWIAITIQSGDTVEGIAASYRIPRDQLLASNCLIGNESLIVGKSIFVPPAPTSTKTVCVPGRAGWILGHTVVRGDTFYNIGARYGLSATDINSANCRSSDLIYAGEVLYVPNVPTRTPTNTPPPGVTFTPAPALTEPLTQTPLPFTFTPVPTKTPIPETPTTAPSPSAVPTQTASPTNTP